MDGNWSGCHAKNDQLRFLRGGMTDIIDIVDLVIASLLAIAVFCIIFVFFWPTTYREKVLSRLIAATETQSKSDTQDNRDRDVTLRPTPKKFFQRIFDAFRLEPQARDNSVAKMLRMAGYRGRGPIITYLAIRVLSPVVMLIATFSYLAFVIRWGQPVSVIFLVSVTVSALGWFAPSVYLANCISRRQAELRKAWPDTLDLLIICVESGMSLDSAFMKVADEIGLQSVEMERELRTLTAELNLLPERRTAYLNLVERTGIDGVKHAVTSLTQAERYGTSVGQSLRVLARESREKRMMEAEAKAAALPPKLTVPMILFFLPILFAVIMSPAILQLLRSR